MHNLFVVRILVKWFILDLDFLSRTELPLPPSPTYDNSLHARPIL